MYTVGLFGLYYTKKIIQDEFINNYCVCKYLNYLINMEFSNQINNIGKKFALLTAANYLKSVMLIITVPKVNLNELCQKYNPLVVIL